MKELEELRQTLTQRIEHAAMIMRYVGFFILATAFVGGMVEMPTGHLVILACIVVAHNVYVHWILLTGRQSKFQSGLNFFVYLVEISMVALILGFGKDPMPGLFVLIVVGYEVFNRRPARIMLVSGVACGTYLAMLLLVHLWTQEKVAVAPTTINCLLILTAGWVVGRIGSFAVGLEEAYVVRIQELASSDAALHTILESAGDPILIYDENEFIIEANQRACEFLRLSSKDLTGKRIRAFLFDDGTFPAKIAVLRARGEGVSEEVVIDAEGEEHHVEATTRTFLRKDRRRYVMALRDQTGAKQLREARREVSSTQERLNHELSQVNALRAGLLATISRRFRSPLSAVLGFLEMLLAGDLGEVSSDQLKALRTSRRSVLRVFRWMDEAIEQGETAPRDHQLSPEEPRQEVSVGHRSDHDPGQEMPS